MSFDHIRVKLAPCITLRKGEPNMHWEQKSKNEGFKIRHFLYEGKFLATLIYKDVEKNEDSTPFGWAQVSKKDQANREKGRQIAYARYQKALKGESKTYGVENKMDEKGTEITVHNFQSPFARFMGIEGNDDLCTYVYDFTFPKLAVEKFVQKFNEKKFGSISLSSKALTINKKKDERIYNQDDDMGNAS